MLSSVVIGAAGGVLMAGILLFLFLETGWQINTLSFGLIVLTASALPWCMNWIEKRGMNGYVAEGVMTAVSLVICLLYMHEASGNRSASEAMTRSFVIVHAVSAVITLIRFLINRAKESA